MELPVMVPAQALEGSQVVSESLELLVHHRKGPAQTLSTKEYTEEPRAHTKGVHEQ